MSIGVGFIFIAVKAEKINYMGLMPGASFKMTEKYLELNLNDEKSVKIAGIIGNKTAKKILGLLAEEELSQGDIAKRLGIGLSNVDYNMKNLVEAGLVEKSRDFFWSVKGKKIPTYRVANRKIIISTKNSFKSLVLSSIFGGIILGGAKVWMNYTASKDILEYSVKSLDYVMAPAAETALNAADSLSRNVNIWSNVLIYALIGLVIGAGIYLLIKNLKGGRRIKI
jgi:DNA-binding transcriptional ArsR family regulator